jgi:hypothetical protein
MMDRFTALGYRVHLAEDEGVWTATARRLDTGDTFGPPVPADAADEAAEQLARWLEWQRAHTTALQALQAAEHTYHRLTADRFANPTLTSGPASAARDALVRLDDLRRELDRVRGQKPWPH